MSNVIEYESSSVAKAVKKACRELNLTEDELKHEIISYGSTGIFGLVGTKKARIRVTVPDPVVSEDADPRPVADATHEEVTAAAPPMAAETQEPASQELDMEGPIELGRETLQKMIDFITTGATITIENKDERIEYHVRGGNTGVLIGKRGQTLEAMQYLVDKIVSKQFEKRVRIQIDVEDYLKTRRANLENMAKRMGEKAKRTGRPMSFGQMNAHDRRIVHIALKEDDMVRTQSMGDGYYRKLVIFPKKRNGRRKRR
jgi:spoIIIJ-associated protein